MVNRRLAFFNTKRTDLQDHLIQKTNSSVTSECAKTIAHTACESLKAQLIHIDTYEPIVRPTSLSNTFFTQKSLLDQKPRPTVIGSILIELLQEAQPALESIIEVNCLQAMTNIIDSLQKLQKEKPYFLADMCRGILTEVAKEIKQSDTATQSTQLDAIKLFSEKWSQMLLKIAFPGGAKDLILPALSPLYRSTIWTIASDAIQDQLSTFLGDIQDDDTLKNETILTMYKEIEQALSEKPQEQGATATTPITRKTAALIFGPVGFTLAIIKFIFQVITSPFTRKGQKHGVSSYENQQKFNDQLYLVANTILQDTDSPLLRFFANHILKKQINSIANNYRIAQKHTAC